MFKKIAKIISNLTSLQMVISISLVATILYWGVWNGYFEQDEWLGIGNFYINESQEFTEYAVGVFTRMLDGNSSRYLFIVPFINYFRYKVFGLKFEYYAILALFLHVINAYFTYSISKVLTKSNQIAIFVSLFFVSLSVNLQAVTWVSTTTTTQISLLLTLVTLLCWSKWLEEKNRRYLYISLLSFLIVLGVKETSYFLLMLFPGVIVYHYFYNFFKYYLGLCVALGLYASDLIGSSIGLGEKLVFPFKSTFQIIFPSELFLKSISQMITFSGLKLDVGRISFDLFVQEKITRPAMIVVGVLVWGVLFIATRREIRLKRLFLFLCGWYFLTFIPLIFIPTTELADIIFSPRNLYISSVPLTILLGIVFDRYRMSKLSIAFLGLIVLVNIYSLRVNLKNKNDIAAVRKSILTTIQSRYPDIPDKTVFYIKSDTSYYGMSDENRFVPFQSGFGRTLIVIYHPLEHFPKELLQDNFLYPIQSEGYREIEGTGFGYFRDFDSLQEAYNLYTIDKDNIYSFSWNGTIESLTDISDSVRVKLQ